MRLFPEGKMFAGHKMSLQAHTAPNRNGDRRVFTFKNSTKHQKAHQPGSRRQDRQGNRQQGNGQSGHRKQRLNCFTCGLPGHLKRDCRSTNNDSTNVAVDFALPTVDFMKAYCNLVKTGRMLWREASIWHQSGQAHGMLHHRQ